MSAIPILLGVTDETYGVTVWIARIEGLKSHLRIIRDHLPDDAAWLRNQVDAAMTEADRYLADPVPSAPSRHPEMSAIEQALTPRENAAAISAHVSRLHSALVALIAQVFRSTCGAPSEMTLCEIDAEFGRLRDAAHSARAALSKATATRS